MSHRARVILVIAVALAAAAGVAGGAVFFGGDDEPETARPEGNPPVLVDLGLARFWSGDTAGAVEGWRTTRSTAPDTAYAVRAGDLLFRGAPPGLPTFVPGFRGPREVQAMEAPEQFAALRRMG